MSETEKPQPHDVTQIMEVYGYDSVNSYLKLGWIYLGMYVDRKPHNSGLDDFHVTEEPVYIVGALPTAKTSNV